MSLPEHRTPEIIRLENVVSNSGDSGVFAFPQLDSEAFMIFGRYIQLYNYIEMNLRRSLEIFCRSGLLNSQNNYQLLQTAQLVPKIIEAISPLDWEDKDEVIRFLREIDRLRDVRHIMAHWAARKFPNDDAIIFFTKDGREIQRLGQTITNDSLTTSILTMPDIRGLLVLVTDLEIWMARRTCEWHQQHIVRNI